ncbi:MAG TPA: 5-oxoprolinase subunit PxpB [Gemmatimonadaceae bacterium]|nr:5-oxoprolinase subunit PxpB [Gemmatimonadaceae bacterium]
MSVGAHPRESMHFSPLGDRAVVIALGATIDEATHRRVRAVCARLEMRPVAGMIECVPAFASVVVHYDPARVPLHASVGDARALARNAPASTQDASPYACMVASLADALTPPLDERPLSAAVVEIPVCYGHEFGPDLVDVARHAHLTPDEVVQMHAAGDYRVHMIGFLPGFPYLGGLSDRLATPRRATPRTLVPAGSVGIGGRQTGIYPMDAPGGWQLIGRTPLALFLPDQEPPTRLRMGDRVRFRPISAQEFERWSPSA